LTCPRETVFAIGGRGGFPESDFDHRFRSLRAHGRILLSSLMAIMMYTVSITSFLKRNVESITHYEQNLLDDLLVSSEPRTGLNSDCTTTASHFATRSSQSASSAASGTWNTCSLSDARRAVARHSSLQVAGPGDAAGLVKSIRVQIPRDGSRSRSAEATSHEVTHEWGFPQPIAHRYLCPVLVIDTCAH
jgi:hypothetical protein